MGEDDVNEREIERLLGDLQKERAYLDRVGYRFPALYDAVEFLLRQSPTPPARVSGGPE